MLGGVSVHSIPSLRFYACPWFSAIMGDCAAMGSILPASDIRKWLSSVVTSKPPPLVRVNWNLPE